MRTSVSSLEPTEKPDIVAHACSPSAGEAKRKIPGQYWPASLA